MWTITQDLTNDEIKEVEIVGPRNCLYSSKQIQNSPLAKEFRLLDDDGNVYYRGFVVGDEFGPLNDFGMPNAGCTSVEILDRGIWTPV